MPEVQTDGREVWRTYGHVTTKISRMHRLPNFFLIVLCCARDRAPLILLIKLYYYMRNFCNLIGLEREREKRDKGSGEERE